MKAAVRTAYGPPESVRVVEIATPEPSPGEVLVRVRASAVNRTDVGYRAGTPPIVRVFAGLRRPKFQVLGTEFAGTVEAVGEGVTSVAPGDRVCGYNEKTFGAHAEYMTIAADGSITTIPGELDFEEAAPSFEGSHYALANLRAGDVGNGTDLLVYGATGAIGSAAVQLAKGFGACVTAVCGTANVALVENLGADRVIDYQSEDFTAHGATYDVVFDAVGKSSFAACKPLLRPRGLFLATELGPFPWNPLLALTTRVGRGRRVKFPLPTDNQEIVRYLRDRIEAAEFRPVIDRTYPLSDIVEAYRFVETGHKVGNVVLSMG
jgi:NADPH:quinone reductase-like Zn-dependent oxidoreductase